MGKIFKYILLTMGICIFVLVMDGFLKENSNKNSDLQYGGGIIKKSYYDWMRLDPPESGGVVTLKLDMD